MERTINVRIEKLPEGVYLATSDDVQGLVAQGRTVAEILRQADIDPDDFLKVRNKRASDANRIGRFFATETTETTEA